VAESGISVVKIFEKLHRQIWITLVINAFCFPAYAHDTDIFLGTGTVPDGARPNILFILDNSTSMASPLSNTGKSRMQTMKESFTEVINTVSGVNVGFMRFNAPGGAVAYPVRNIDEVVTASMSTTPALLESSDDAVEFLGDFSVDLNSQTLHMGSTSLPGARTTEITVPISNASAQLEENVNNGRSQGVPTDFTFDGSTRLGLQFSNLGIPANATIEEARLVFTSNDRESGSTTFTISADNIVNAEAFTGSDNELIKRLGNQTAVSISWPMTTDWALDVEYRSEDLSSVIQELIGLVGWSENNVISL
jgi:hypothetical protein